MTNPPVYRIPTYPKEFLVAFFCVGVAVAIHGRHVTLEWSQHLDRLSCRTTLEIPPHWMAL